MTLLFFLLFVVSQILSVLAVFVTLPYPKLTLWESYKMAVPFSWLAWIPLTYALSINTLGANQTIFLLIVIQFAVIVAANYFYLGKTVSTSEVVAFALLVVAYWISNDGVISSRINSKSAADASAASATTLKPAKPCTDAYKSDCNDQKADHPLVLPIDEETLLSS